MITALAAGLFVFVLSAGVVVFLAVSGSEMSWTDNDGSSALVETDNEANERIPEIDRASTDEYIEADVGFPDTLNPLLAKSPGEQAVAAMLFRSLLGTDSSGDPEPDLATDWQVSSDGQTYTVRLDPNAQWHDGEPLTVEDVLFTISLVKDGDFPGDADLSQFWRGITVRQSGEREIEFRLLEPYVGFIHHLRLPILPKHRFGSVMAADLDALELDEEAIGSGPYELSEIDADEQWIRFSATTSSSESPGFSDVRFRYFDDRHEAVEAFRDGETDGVSYIPLDVLNDPATIPEDASIFGPSMSGYTAFYFNVRHPYFREANTRRAIEHAIDREAIVESVLAGHAIPGSSPIPEMFSAHAPGSHAEHDPSAAEDLLEREGWVIEDGENIRQRDGEYFLIPLIVNSDDPQRIAVANLIQEQLQDVGISVDVQVIPTSDVQQALAARQFTAVVFGWHTDNGSLDCYQLWHSSQRETGSNFTGFADSGADEHLLSARHATSIDERNQHYAEFQNVFAEQVPAVVLFYPRYHFAVSERVQGAEPVPLVNPGDRVRQIPGWHPSES